MLSQQAHSLVGGTGSPKADSPRGMLDDDSPVTAPDVIPMAYTAPASPRIHKEINQSPVPRGSPNIPSPQPPEGYYAVPVPAQLASTSPAPQEHTSHYPRPALEGNEINPSSPTVYDYPRNQVPQPESAGSTRTIPTAVYDIPNPARKQGQRSPYEGVSIRPMDSAQRAASKPKANGGHRYGIVKPAGTGHSYSRSRPDPMSQQPMEKMRPHAERPYKSSGPRVQRQQTEL